MLNEKTNSVKSGFADIDERFGGLRRGDTYLLAGSPGMGKTAFANNIWNNVKNFATGISHIFDTTDIDIDEVYNLCKLVNGDIDPIIIDFLQRIKGYDECSIDVPAKAKLIARLIVRNKNMRITDEAMDKIHIIMENAAGNSDFGNGRFVRNIIEKARLAQSIRLIKLDYEKVTADDVATITADDIEIPVTDKKSVKKIGFCA